MEKGTFDRQQVKEMSGPQMRKETGWHMAKDIFGWQMMKLQSD